MRELNIDIETFSTRDLKKVGVYKYVECPSFDVLLFAYSFDGGPVKVIDLLSGEYIPSEVLDALRDPSILKTAFNANFELTCLNRYLPEVYGITTPVDQWECTAVKCAMLGLPLQLEAVARVLRLPVEKDARGSALIRYFSIPCKPSKANGERTRNYPSHDLQKWEEYKQYNKRDVEVEVSVRQWASFFKIPSFERLLWLQDQAINNKGVLIDTVLAVNAVRIDKVNSEALLNEVSAVTKLDNPNSDAQLKAWLKEQDAELPNMTKETVSAALKRKDYPKKAKHILRLREQFKKSSIKKYAALLRASCDDARIRGIIQFYGANRTGRYAGRIFQPQNLPRIDEHLFGGKGELLDTARRLVKDYDIAGLDFVFNSVSDVLSQLIRTAIIPEKGKVFIISDFSAIEARIIAWLANEEWRMEVFRTHGKIYEASASKMFGIPIEQCGKGTDYRQRGKVAELALGYQGSAGALETMGALKMGIPLQDLRPMVKAWRKENPNIVKLWYDTEESVIECIKYGRKVTLHRGITAEVRNEILFVKLPSGRELAYFRPALRVKKYAKVRFIKEFKEFSENDRTVLPLDKAKLLASNKVGSIEGEPYNKETIVYQGMDQVTKQWRTVDSYGGKLVENLVQAIARDCLVFAKHNLYKAGYFTVLHIHDEVVIEAEPDLSSTKEVDEIMSIPPYWGVDIPLTAESYISHYYKKD